MKYAKFSALAALTLLALGLVGCSLLRGGAEPALQLTAKDNGTEQFVRVGQDLIVTLESNPTTGYKWDVDGDLPPGLKAEEPKYESQSKAIGGGGAETWTFHGVAAGEPGTLRLKYWRSFESTVAPIKTFEVKLQVVPQ